MEKKLVHIAFKHGHNDPRIFRKECVSLAKNPDYDVTYITSDINSPQINDRDEEGVHKVILKAYPKRILRQFLYFRDIKKYIRQNENVALVQLHEAPLLLIALWIKRRGIKVIFDSHEDYHKQITVSHNGSIIYKLIAEAYKIYEKHVCKRIDGVIFPCRMIGYDVFDYDVKRMVYLDNTPIMISEPFEIKEKEDFISCYTGSISEERGVVNNIKAWNRAGVKGVLAGNFANKTLEDQVRGMKEFENVDYRGFCSIEDVHEIYRETSVGMATLLDRGQYHKGCNLPTKVCEYMMFGIPSIIYRTVYIESIMREYEFGIMVDPENVEEIADALEYFKNHPEEAARMGRNGRKAVEERFNWGIEEKKLFALYKEVLDGSYE